MRVNVLDIFFFVLKSWDRSKFRADFNTSQVDGVPLWFKWNWSIYWYWNKQFKQNDNINSSTGQSATPAAKLDMPQRIHRLKTNVWDHPRAPLSDLGHSRARCVVFLLCWYICSSTFVGSIFNVLFIKTHLCFACSFWLQRFDYFPLKISTCCGHSIRKIFIASRRIFWLQCFDCLPFIINTPAVVFQWEE